MKKTAIILFPCVVMLCLIHSTPAVDDRAVQSSPPVAITFEFNSNKVYLPIRIGNDPAPRWFILDSGCPFTCIDLDLAGRLQLPVEGLRRIGGAGTESTVVGRTRELRLHIGNLPYQPSEPMALRVHAVVAATEGRSVDGLIGGDFFQQYVVEIDYAKRQLLVTPAPQFKYAGVGTIVPLHLSQGHASVVGELQFTTGDPVRGHFVVDTGLRLGLALNTPFVNREQLLNRTGAKLRATVGGGLGGEVIHHVGRLSALKIGEATVHQPVISMSQERTGALAMDDSQGILGADVLRRFRVILDYSRRQMILEPNPDAPPTYEFDMSGMFLRAEGDDFRTIKVMSVIPGGPAAQAGLQKGDVLLAVDGVSDNSFNLENIRRSFFQPGAQRRLKVGRDGTTREVTLTLRRLV